MHVHGCNVGGSPLEHNAQLFFFARDMVVRQTDRFWEALSGWQNVKLLSCTQTKDSCPLVRTPSKHLLGWRLVKLTRPLPSIICLFTRQSEHITSLVKPPNYY